MSILACGRRVSLLPPSYLPVHFTIRQTRVTSCTLLLTCSFQRATDACHCFHPVTYLLISVLGRRVSLLVPHFRARRVRATSCTQSLACTFQSAAGVCHVLSIIKTELNHKLVQPRNNLWSSLAERIDEKI